MNNLVVFNDSHQSDGFEKGVALINKKLEKHELRVKLQFIEDYAMVTNLSCPNCESIVYIYYPKEKGDA